MKGLSMSLLFWGISTIFVNTLSPEKTYCQGWEDGHCAGWRDVKGIHAICPIAPLCPLPEIEKDTYQDGYNRGFKVGIKDAEKSN